VIPYCDGQRHSHQPFDTAYPLTHLGQTFQEDAQTIHDPQPAPNAADSSEDKTQQDPGGQDVDLAMEGLTRNAVKPMEVVPVQICHTTFVILICNYHHTSAVFFAIQPVASALSFLFAFKCLL
jgi:hypothetical protein